MAELSEENQVIMDETEGTFEMFAKNKKLNKKNLEAFLTTVGVKDAEIKKLALEQFKGKDEWDVNEVKTLMQTALANADMKTAFDAFDADGSGYISKEELSQALGNFGFELSEAEVEEMINGLDDMYKNEEDEVTFEGFKFLMKDE